MEREREERQRGGGRKILRKGDKEKMEKRERERER
jgi:hypothetical protein